MTLRVLQNISQKGRKMVLKSQILENVATSGQLTEVEVDPASEVTENGRSSWKVLSYVIHENFYPQTNDEPKFKTITDVERLVLENYTGTNTYIMRRV